MRSDATFFKFHKLIVVISNHLKCGCDKCNIIVYIVCTYFVATYNDNSGHKWFPQSKSTLGIQILFDCVLSITAVSRLQCKEIQQCHSRPWTSRICCAISEINNLTQEFARENTMRPYIN